MTTRRNPSAAGCHLTGTEGTLARVGGLMISAKTTDGGEKLFA